MAETVILAVDDDLRDLRADQRCLQSVRRIAAREITVDSKPLETRFVYKE